MSGKRIVIEKACPVHGLYDQPPHTAYGGCIGSTRRTLTEGQYVLIARICSECGGTFGTCFNAKL